jgi:hypothetical protein
MIFDFCLSVIDGNRFEALLAVHDGCCRVRPGSLNKTLREGGADCPIVWAWAGEPIGVAKLSALSGAVLVKGSMRIELPAAAKTIDVMQRERRPRRAGLLCDLVKVLPNGEVSEVRLHAFSFGVADALDVVPDPDLAAVAGVREYRNVARDVAEFYRRLAED